jgi:hypothetical protein
MARTNPPAVDDTFDVGPELFGGAPRLGLGLRTA